MRASGLAAEHDDLGAEPGQPREGFLHVGHLLVSICVRPRHFERRRKKQVDHRNGKADLLDVYHAFSNASSDNAAISVVPSLVLARRLSQNRVGAP